MSLHHTRRAPPYAWAVVLAVATVVGVLAASCMTPFVALGTMAAATLPRGRALATVGAVWLAEQAIGFGLLHYPATPASFAWGAALGVAAACAMLTASLAVGPGRTSALRLTGGFAAGFIVYEGLLWAFAHVAGGLSTFTPAIVRLIALNEGGWLVGLAAAHLVLTWAAPRLFGRAPRLRLA